MEFIVMIVTGAIVYLYASHKKLKKHNKNDLTPYEIKYKKHQEAINKRVKGGIL